jgi:tetratricopeptide (TPR) repeat protein
LPLVEFRRRLALALSADDTPYPAAPEPDSGPEGLRSFLGFQYVLLAPLFGFGLVELAFDDNGALELVYETDDGRERKSVQAFRESIRQQVRALAQNEDESESPFAIDLSALPAAEKAMAVSDYDRTIDLLGSWPGPLSMLLRTAEGQSLASDVKATLAHALGLLGTAYANRGRHDWADEVMRLGIQWGQEGSAAGELFWRMGEASVARDRYGEAIGLLRRALSLGASRAAALPLLARCYEARDRWVAAALCAEEALVEGAKEEEMRALIDRARDHLGDPWTRFRERFAAPRPLVETVPAPPIED